MTGTQPLPRRDAYTPPDWWQPYTTEFPRWRAWQGASQLWARLPGTMRVCHDDNAESLAGQIRTAEASTPADSAEASSSPTLLARQHRK